MTLRPEQYDAMRLLALPKAIRPTYAEIAKTCGVDASTLWRWRTDPAFTGELKRTMMTLSAERLPDVLEALTDAAVEDRNAAAGKTILQAHGMLTDNLVVETKTSDALDMEAIKRRLAGYAKGNVAEADKDVI